MTFDFTNQTAVVTGGTRGIGKAICAALLRAGAKVVATYARDERSANEFAAEFASYPLEIAQFDVASYAHAERFFTNFDNSHDSLEILVNNAGIRRDGVVGMMPVEDWKAVLDTNLGGTYSMTKLGLLRMLPSRYGRIVNITSPSGALGFAGQCNYAAAKAGQVAFAKSVSKEVAKRKITVNCVSPGFIDTDLISDLSDEQKQTYREQIPMKRFGQVDEVATAVLFLASKEASYINGAVLEVTGGL